MNRATTRPATARLGILSLVLFVGHVAGCLPCGTATRFLLLHGIVLDASALDVPSDVLRITAWTSTGGEFTGSGGGLHTVSPSSDTGSFELRIVSDNTTTVCGSSVPTDFPAFPSPDEILVIIERESCEQRFTIEINEDTVVDLSFPDFTIELKDPILLPLCEEVSGK